MSDERPSLEETAGHANSADATARDAQETEPLRVEMTAGSSEPETESETGQVAFNCSEFDKLLRASPKPSRDT